MNAKKNEQISSAAQSPVSAELQQLGSALSTNEDLVSALNVRLLSVMSSSASNVRLVSSPTPGLCASEVSIESAECSSLERAIGDMTQQVDSANEMLKSILGALRI